MKFYNSVGYKIVVPNILIVLSFTFITMVVGEGVFSDILEKYILKNEIEKINHIYIDDFEEIMDNALKVSRDIVNNPIIIKFLSKKDKKVLTDDIKKTLNYIYKVNNFHTVYLVSELTKNYYSNEGFLKILDLTKEENYWYVEGKKKSSRYEVNIDDSVVGNLNLWIDMKVLGDDGKFLGYAGIGMDIGSIIKKLNMISKDLSAKVYLYNSQDKLIAKSSNVEYEDQYISDGKESQKRFFDYKNENGEHRYIIKHSIEPFGIALYIDVEQDMFFAKFEPLFDFFIKMQIFLIVLIIIVGAWIAINVVVNPFNEFIKKLKEFPNAKIDKLNFIKSSNEFEAVGKAFIRAQKMINNNIKELEELNHSLEDKVREKTQVLEETNRNLQKFIVVIKEKNIELQHATDMANAALESRSQFISGVSHELRTPLNAIINFTDQLDEDFEEMLHDKELQEDFKEYIKIVLRNSKYLLDLINDVLHFSKIEAGKLEYDVSKVDIRSIIESALKSVQSLLKRKNLRITTTYHADNPIVTVDERRMLQIILNILSNSIKFTAIGFIKIDVDRSDGHILFSIEDSGKGIPKDKLEHIFEPFKQLNTFDSGTGLGLAITKQMCDDMGIEVKVESELGKGTKFTFILKEPQVG